MKNNLIRLSVYVVLGWLVHAMLASVYIRQFASTKSLGFRLVHVVEIGLVMTATFWLFRRSDSALPAWQVALAALATLGVIDLIAFIALPNLRQQFDTVHFIAAYSVVILSALLVVR